MKTRILCVILLFAVCLLASCDSQPTQTAETNSQPSSDLSAAAAASSTPKPPTATPDSPTGTSAATVAPHDTLLLQQQLYDLGYTDVGLPDGQADEQFTAGLKHFELLNHLPVDGLEDETIWEILETNAIPYYPPPAFAGKVYGVDLATMMCDDHMLQERLATFGLLEPGIDEWTIGAFGSETQKALKEFQKQFMTTQSGKPDLVTWQALFSPLTSLRVNEPRGEVEAWQTTLYPADSGVVAMAWDGSNLWLAVSKGMTVYDNYLLRIAPSAHPAEAVQVIRVRACDTLDATIYNMVYAGGKLWLLYNSDLQGNPEPMVQMVDPVNGTYSAPFKFATCPDGFCVSAYAMGATRSAVWVTGNDRAYGLDLSNGSVKVSWPVGYVPSGEMAFDGQCMWYIGESGMQAFNTNGGRCRGIEGVSILPVGQPESDGKLIWTAGYGYLSQLNLDTGVGIDLEPPVSSPGIITYADEILWVTDAGANRVIGMSTLDGGWGDPIPLDGINPAFMLVENGHLWIYYADSRSVQRLDVSGYTTRPSNHTATPAFTATPTATPPVLSRTLKLNTPRMEGDDVRMLQEQLLALGYNEVGSADGIFGQLTEQAVMRYQQETGLEADGIVGPLTWAALFAAH